MSANQTRLSSLTNAALIPSLRSREDVPTLEVQEQNASVWSSPPTSLGSDLRVRVAMQTAASPTVSAHHSSLDLVVRNEICGKMPMSAFRLEPR